MALPKRLPVSGRGKELFSMQCIADLLPSIGGKNDRHLHDSRFPFWFHPVFGNGLAAADLPQRLFTTRVIEFFDPVAAVPAGPITRQAWVTLLSSSASRSSPTRLLINLVSFMS